MIIDIDNLGRSGGGSSDLFIATYGTTTFAQITAAVTAGKSVYLTGITGRTGIYVPLLSIGGTKAIFEGINPEMNNTTLTHYTINYDGTWLTNSYQLAETDDVPDISTNIFTDASSDAKAASPKAVKTFVAPLMYKVIVIDFNENQDSVTIPGVFGDMHIKEIAAVNCATLKLSHGSTVQQAVTPGSSLNIAILAAENMVWDITRTTEGQTAAISVKYLDDVYV